MLGSPVDFIPRGNHVQTKHCKTIGFCSIHLQSMHSITLHCEILLVSLAPPKLFKAFELLQRPIIQPAETTRPSQEVVHADDDVIPRCNSTNTKHKDNCAELFITCTSKNSVTGPKYLIYQHSRIKGKSSQLCAV